MIAALAPPAGSKRAPARAALMSSDFIVFIFLTPCGHIKQIFEQPNDAQPNHAQAGGSNCIFWTKDQFS